MINCVVAGAILGIVGLGLDLGTGGSIVLGCVGVGLAFVFFGVWARRWIVRSARELVVRFPTPRDGDTL